MTSPTPAPVGLWRVAAAAGLMLGAAVGAHVAAGGSLPPAGVLGLLGSVLAIVAAVVIRVGARRWLSLGLVGGTQYVSHQLFVVTSQWSSGAGHGSVGSCEHRHGHAGVAQCAPASSSGDVAVYDGGAAWMDARMVVLHVAATVAVGLLLRQGDRLLAALLAALRPLWRRPATTGYPFRPLRLHVVEVPAAVPWALVCVALRPRRGPPRLAGVARYLPA